MPSSGLPFHPSLHPSFLFLLFLIVPFFSLPQYIQTLTARTSVFFPRHTHTHTHTSHTPTRTPTHINMHAGQCMYVRLHRFLIWHAKAAVTRNLLCVLCPCTAMIQNKQTGLTETHTHTHTHSEEVASQYENTSLSLPSSYPCLLLFFCPFILLF